MLGPEADGTGSSGMGMTNQKTGRYQTFKAKNAIRTFSGVDGP